MAFSKPEARAATALVEAQEAVVEALPAVSKDAGPLTDEDGYVAIAHATILKVREALGKIAGLTPAPEPMGKNQDADT